jgi:hypothetical protein
MIRNFAVSVTMVLALVLMLPSVGFAYEPAMKILGPDGQDITGNIQEIMEDSPLMVQEFSRAFDKIVDAANKAAGENAGKQSDDDSDEPAEVEVANSGGSSGGSSGDASGDASGEVSGDASGDVSGDEVAEGGEDGEEGGEGGDVEVEEELFIKWTVQLNEDGTMGLVDQGNPEVTAQFPVGGGSQMFNVCTVAKITKSINEKGAIAGTLTGDIVTEKEPPVPANGFSSAGFDQTWTNGSTNGDDNSYAGDVSVSTSANKIDVAVLDITPPELFITLDASDGRSSSIINIKSTASHEPVIQIPEDSNPRDFYEDEDASPFDPDRMLSNGYIQGKAKLVTAEGSLFNPTGDHEKLEATLRSELIPGTRNYDAKIKGDNLGDIKALYVPENVRLRILMQAVDADETFDEIIPDEGEDLNKYNAVVNSIGQVYQDFRRDVNKGEGQVNHIFAGRSDNTATFPGIKAGSLQWQIVLKDGSLDTEYAAPTDPETPLHVIFRQSDYVADADPEDANYFLVSEVEDDAGNKTTVRIPIWVTPTSFETRDMQR